MVELFHKIFTHEYVLAVYGVLLWQVEQWYRSKKPFKDFYKESYHNIGRSLIWVGIVIVFDDEILAKYNQWAAMDYMVVPIYMYTVAGFFIDLIRSKIFNRF